MTTYNRWNIPIIGGTLGGSKNSHPDGVVDLKQLSQAVHPNKTPANIGSCGKKNSHA